MSERKNIDQFFQEKFKDFETNPPEFTWPELEEKLKKKNKKRIIPFWWKLSGIAAAFLIGFFIAEGITASRNEVSKSVVIQETKKSNLNVPDQHNSIVGKPESESQKTEKLTNEIGQNPIVQSDEKNPDDENAATSVSDKKIIFGKSSNVNSKRKTFSNDNSNRAVAETNAGKTNRKNQKSAEKLNSAAKHQTKITKAEDENSATAIAISDFNKNNPAAANANQRQENSVVNVDLKNTGKPTKAIAVSEDVNQIKQSDSTSIAAIPNALEELLKQKEQKIVVTEAKKEKWQITSNVAPVYFGSTSAGSPIDSSFAGNQKDYGTNLSFGLGVNYALSNKLKIRAGVNKVSFNYHTNDVFVSAGIQGKQLENVTLSTESQFLNVTNSYKGNDPVNTTSSPANTTLSTDQSEGYLNQKMGYIEVPLELSYKLLDKTFGINIIGGVSTLFLNENEISVVSSGYATNLGEANNLNKTHFSTNVGLGLSYKFLKAFEANFEPMFKYQVNTFNKNNGDFKPYFFGLYTGLSFRF